jgi:hypothetical protein
VFNCTVLSLQLIKLYFVVYSKALADHVEHKHKVFNCTSCSKSHCDYVTLARHHRDDHRFGVFECTQCCYRSELRSQISKHFTAEHSKILRCTGAGCTYETKYHTNLKRHKRKPHRGLTKKIVTIDVDDEHTDWIDIRSTFNIPLISGKMSLDELSQEYSCEDVIYQKKIAVCIVFINSTIDCLIFYLILYRI